MNWGIQNETSRFFGNATGFWVLSTSVPFVPLGSSPRVPDTPLHSALRSAPEGSSGLAMLARLAPRLGLPAERGARQNSSAECLSMSFKVSFRVLFRVSFKLLFGILSHSMMEWGAAIAQRRAESGVRS